MNALLTADVTLLAVAAWVSVFFVIPSCLRTLFRNHMWRLRDSIVDEIRSDHYRDAAQPKHLVEEIELAIRCAREISVFRLGLLAAVTRGVEPPPARERFDLDATDPADREELKLKLGEFRMALLRHAVFGGPSGWIFLILVGFCATLIALIRTVFRGLGVRNVYTAVKASLKQEIPYEPETALALLGARPKDRDRHLSAYV